MQYNSLNSIIKKELNYTLNGEDKGYTLDYEYNDKKHPHAPSSIANNQQPQARNYTYDGNGNPISYDEFKGFRSMVWDEENRLRGINDNGRLHLYTYDHTGERALKSSAESSMAVINGLASAVITHTEDYTAYVSPYFVVQKGKFTKHYFEGSSRIVSKLGEGTFSHKNTGIMAGGLDYLKRTQKEQEARDRYIQGLKVPPGPPTQHGIYASPEWTKQPYASIDWESISQNQEPPAGWPRYPRFNEPGDVPGPPVQFGEAITNKTAKAGFNFIPNGVEEKNIYYYHPDHLGSSSYITDKNGEVIQHTEYMAFGETFVDEHSVSPTRPYLFNGKELDFETGLYYYGARYYDPKTSIFLNVDPLAEKYPAMSPYSYVANNPINAIDPDGRLIIFINGQHAGDGGKRKYWNGLDDVIANRFKDYRARYYDGASGGWKNTSITLLTWTLGSNLYSGNRFRLGRSRGYEQAKSIYNSLGEGETIKVATHSMGTAYGKGFVKGLKKYARENKIAHKIERVLDLASFQGSELQAESGILTEQIAHTNDGVAGVSRIQGVSDDNFHETRENVEWSPTRWLDEHSVDSFKNEIGIIKEGNAKTGYQNSNNEIKVEYEQRGEK